jgi:hypothetical protein
LCFVSTFCVDDQLLECKKRLHPFFVHFGLDDVLEQNQFVQTSAEPEDIEKYFSLLLDLESGMLLLGE